MAGVGAKRTGWCSGPLLTQYDMRSHRVDMREGLRPVDVGSPERQLQGAPSLRQDLIDCEEEALPTLAIRNGKSLEHNDRVQMLS